jgi:CBS domain-containing protein
MDLPEPTPEARAGAPTADLNTTLRDALSAMLASGSDTLLVTDGDGNVAGMLTIDLVTRLLSTAPDEVTA